MNRRNPLRRDVQANQRYRQWQGLLDLSTQLALAGLKAQRIPVTQAWKIWCKRWARASQEHQKSNLWLAERLHAREKILKPNR